MLTWSERVHGHVSKLLNAFKNLTHEQRLHYLKRLTLNTRRKRCNLIEIFKTFGSNNYSCKNQLRDLYVDYQVSFSLYKVCFSASPV